VRVVLASSSPRRARVLRALGLDPVVRPTGADETPLPGESPAALVRRLALAKASCVPVSRGDVVLAADTVVVLGRRVLGKPRDARHARSMLARLSGRTHSVLTGVAVRSAATVLVSIDRTRVRFRRMSRAEIAAYVESGEPMDKAGAYHVDGGGAAFIESIEGSPTNVAGHAITTARRLIVAAARRAVSARPVSRGAARRTSRPRAAKR
jgi:septum formation protein